MEERTVSGRSAHRSAKRSRSSGNPVRPLFVRSVVLYRRRGVSDCRDVLGSASGGVAMLLSLIDLRWGGIVALFWVCAVGGSSPPAATTYHEITLED